MTTYTATNADEIVTAIKRSISHGEIVRVEVPSLAEGEQWVSDRSESYDSTETDDLSADTRMLDIWGDDGQGGEFRLYLVTT